VLLRPEVRERAEPAIELVLVRIAGYVAGNAITSGICALAATIGLIVFRPVLDPAGDLGRFRGSHPDGRLLRGGDSGDRSSRSSFHL
jgi:hypothetical protein